jgi:excisionase family DNA binding protein
MARRTVATDKSRALARQEAAEDLGVSVSVIDDMVKAGRLDTVTIGKWPKITRASIDAVLAGQR